MERTSRSRFRRTCHSWYVGGGGGGIFVRSRRPGVSCYGVLAGNGNRGRCALRVLIVLCICAFVYQCVGVVYPCGRRDCPRIIYLFHLKSTSTARRPPRPNMYGSAPRWWCTLKNWLPSPLEAICTEWTPAPSIIGNHNARVLGTTITALALHLLKCANTTPTDGGCGKQ